MEKFLGLYTTRKKDNGDYEVVSFPIGEKQIEIHDFTYSSPRMELPSLTANFFHKSCLDDLWSSCEFVIFRGEKYFITKTPNSSKDNQDARYKHTITFTSERSILSTTYFYDTVNKETDHIGIANKYCSNSSNVFFVGTISEFIPRLNASLKYSNIDYNVVLDVDDISEERLNSSKEFSCENITNFEALKQAFETWDIPFYFIGKECHFGYFDKSLDLTDRGAISYGCKNELLSIQRTNSSDKIITRATGLGSSENIPFYYPNDSEKGNFIFEHTLSDLEIVDANKLANNVKDKEVYTYTDVTKYPSIDMSNNLLVVQHDLETGDKTEYTTTIGEPIYVGNLDNLHKQRHDIIVEFELIESSQVSVLFTAYNDYENITFSDAQFVSIEDCNSNNVVNYWSGNDGGLIYTDNVLGKGHYRVKVSGLNVNKPYPLTNSYSYTVSLDVNIYGEVEYEYAWISQNNSKITNLRKVGVAYDETLEDLGKKFRLEITELLPYQNTLMPSIFSRGQAFNGNVQAEGGILGVERYYDAKNNIYSISEKDSTIHYNNELTKYNRSENIYTFDDIKPEIEGVRNSDGELICEIIDVAYDDDDNDYTLGEEHGNSANTYSHPYFYVKIRKTDGEQGKGFNLFDHAIEGEVMTFQINSGNLNGCKFAVQAIETSNNVFKNPVQVDENGNLVSGNWQQKTNGTNFIDSQQDTRKNEVWIVLLKEDTTFGIIMPNVANNYKMDVTKPSNNTFNITGISLPKEYILAAERRLDEAIVVEMSEDNSEKFKYSLDLSRIFLAKDNDEKQANSFFSKLNESSKIKIGYNGKELEQYVSSYSYNCSDSESLPKVTIEVSDEITKKKTWTEKITNSAQQKAAVTATNKTKTIIKESNLATSKEVEEKATKSSSLEGYGITDVYIQEDGTIVIGKASVKPLTSGNNTPIDWNKVVSKRDFIQLWKTEMSKWFAIDENNNGVYPVDNRGFFSNSYISAKGISPSIGGGDSGLIKQVYGYSDINKSFNNINLNDTFNAYTISRLSARILALEQNSSGSGGGGAADTIEWEKILYKPTWLVDEKPKVSYFDNDAKYITNDSLADYATQKWVEDKNYITSSSLNGYATEVWVNGKGYAIATDVANTYVTKTTFNTLKTDFDNLSALLNDDVQGKINTWHEVVDFLDEYSGSQDLATILSTMNADIASRLEKTKFAEYFSNEMAKWFVKDDANKGIKPVNSYGLYSDTYVSAKGVSSGTGGSGGGTSYDRLDSWAEYTSAKAGYVLSALLGYDLHTRVNNLASSLGGYLPLSGGTIEDSTGGALAVNRTNSAESYIRLLSRGAFKGAITAGNETYGTALYNAVNGYYLGITDDGTPYYIGASRYSLIHSGNIGSQSVAYAESAGDSDMLGGVTHQSYMTSFRSTTQDVNQNPYTAERPYILRVGSGNANLPNGMQYGNIAHFSAYGADTAFELFGAYAGQTLMYRCGETNAMFSRGWKTIAFTDSNVASATKLQTPRTIWGQSFDGSGNVSGDIHLNNSKIYWHSDNNNYYIDNYYDNVNSPFMRYMSYSGHIFMTGNGEAIRIKSNKNVLIGTTTDNGTKLQVNYTSLYTGIEVTKESGNEASIGFKSDVGRSVVGIWGSGLNLWNEGLGTALTIPVSSNNVLIGTAVDNGARLQVGGSVVASGSVTAKSSSDYRLKCEFDYDVDYQERLLSLGKVCDFNYTPHAQEREFAFADDKRHTSVIWQDARKANITGFCSVEEDGYGTVNPLSSDLIFTMVGAIQQGITKTEKIEERVVRLEKENEALRKEINDMRGGSYGC